MFTHYLNAALRHFRQHKLTTSINVVGLALGIACFIAAYAIVGYLRSSEAALPNASRTYFLAHLGNGKIPMTAEGREAPEARFSGPGGRTCDRRSGVQPRQRYAQPEGRELASGVSPVFVIRNFSTSSRWNLSPGTEPARSPARAVWCYRSKLHASSLAHPTWWADASR